MWYISRSFLVEYYQFPSSTKTTNISISDMVLFCLLDEINGPMEKFVNNSPHFPVNDFLRCFEICVRIFRAKLHQGPLHSVGTYFFKMGDPYRYQVEYVRDRCARDRVCHVTADRLRVI